MTKRITIICPDETAIIISRLMIDQSIDFRIETTTEDSGSSAGPAEMKWKTGSLPAGKKRNVGKKRNRGSEAVLRVGMFAQPEGFRLAAIEDMAERLGLSRRTGSAALSYATNKLHLVYSPGDGRYFLTDRGMKEAKSLPPLVGELAKKETA